MDWSPMCDSRHRDRAGEATSVDQSCDMALKILGSSTLVSSLNVNRDQQYARKVNCPA